MVNLTPKQEKFCIAYLETGNASEAYRRSYDISKSNDASVNRKAKELIDNGKIAARLEELKKPVIQKMELTLEKVIAENMRLAFFDMRTLFNENGTLKPVSEWTDAIGASVKSIEVNELFEGSGKDRIRIGETKKVSFWDKGAAIDKLMKHLGGYEQDNKQKGNALQDFYKAISGGSLPIAHDVEGEVIENDVIQSPNPVKVAEPVKKPANKKTLIGVNNGRD